MSSKFEVLSNINVNNKTQKKDGLTYLSWSYAIDEFTRQCPDFDYEILPYTYDENLGYMVYTSVTVDGKKKTMWLPVMDARNKAMKKEPYEYQTRYGTKTVEQASMTDINKAYMRCLVKNFAVFGLGLYIYNGDDLPDVPSESKISPKTYELLKMAYTKEEIKAMYVELGITKGSDMGEEYAQKKLLEKNKSLEKNTEETKKEFY